MIEVIVQIEQAVASPICTRRVQFSMRTCTYICFTGAVYLMQRSKHVLAACRPSLGLAPGRASQFPRGYCGRDDARL